MLHDDTRLIACTLGSKATVNDKYKQINTNKWQKKYTSHALQLHVVELVGAAVQHGYRCEQAYRDGTGHPPVQLVDTPAAQQVHDLPLLLGPHASKDSDIAHDGLHQRQVLLLQQLLKGWACDTALRLPLYSTSHYFGYVQYIEMLILYIHTLIY